MLMGKKWLVPDELRTWTIQIYYTARDDNGKAFRATSFFQCEARDIPSAYRLAEEADWQGREPVKFGAIF